MVYQRMGPGFRVRLKTEGYPAKPLLMRRHLTGRHFWDTSDPCPLGTITSQLTPKSAPGRVRAGKMATSTNGRVQRYGTCSSRTEGLTVLKRKAR